MPDHTITVTLDDEQEAAAQLAADKSKMSIEQVLAEVLIRGLVSEVYTLRQAIQSQFLQADPTMTKADIIAIAKTGGL